MEFSRWMASGDSPFSKRLRFSIREAAFSAARLFKLMRFLGCFIGEIRSTVGIELRDSLIGLAQSVNHPPHAPTRSKIRITPEAVGWRS